MMIRRAPQTPRAVSLGQKVLAVGVVFFFGVLLVTSFFGRKGLMEIRRTRKEYNALLSVEQRLEAEKARLMKEIAELEQNPLAVERTARERLWLMGEDEVVIIPRKK